MTKKFIRVREHTIVAPKIQSPVHITTVEATFFDIQLVHGWCSALQIICI